MRVLSAAQDLIAAKKNRATHLRVKIDRGGGDFVDMTTLAGRNWVDGAVITDSASNPTVQARVGLNRQVFDLNLAPLVSGKLNSAGTIIALSNPLIIETATLPQDTPPQDADFEEVFRGAIDSDDWAKPVIELQCRDEGRLLSNTFIETQQVYGDDGGSVGVEDVIQSILDDNINTPALGSVTLFFVDGTGGTPRPQGGASDPAWQIQKFIQSKMSVMEAVRRLALQIGWECRYRWHENTSAFQLQLYEPDRSASTPLRTFGPDFYGDPSRLGIAINNIRNVIEVTFGVGNDRTTAIVTDAASIAKYGRFWMGITEGSSSGIDSSVEALRMANGALSDLAEPDLMKSVPIPYFWAAELGGLYTFQKNGSLFDTDQDLAVNTLRHTLRRGMAVTELGVSGKATGGIKRWLEVEGKRAAPAVDLRSDDAIGVTSEPFIGSIVINTDDPRTQSPPIPDWLYTQVFIKAKSAGGTYPAFDVDTDPDSFLKAQNKATRFPITDLNYGEEYSARVVVVDEKFNRAAVSTFVLQATEQVGPHHENPEGEFGVINKNPSFGIHTKDETLFPMDSILMSTGAVWGAASTEFFFEASTVFSGNRALKYNGEPLPGSGFNTRIVTNNFNVVSEDRLYGLEFGWQHDGNGVGDTGVTWAPLIRFFDKDKVQIGVDTSLLETLRNYGPQTPTNVPANTPIIDRGWFTTPANTSYIKIVLHVEIDDINLSPQTDHPKLVWDYLRLKRALVKLDVAAGTNDRTILANVWVQPWLSQVQLDNAGGYVQGTPGIPQDHSYTIPFDGEYVIRGRGQLTATIATDRKLIARFTLDPVGAAPKAQLVQAPPFLKRGSSVEDAPKADVILQAFFNAGDVIALEVLHNNSSTETLDDSECYLKIAQLGDHI